MRSSARSFFAVQICSFFISLLLFFGITFIAPRTTEAQTETAIVTSTTAVPDTAFSAQAVIADSLAWMHCLLTGRSPHISLPCLGVDPETQKLKYLSTTFPENAQVGGLLGTMSGMIATLYTPTVSTHDYATYIASNFGIVKPAYAQTCDYKRLGTGYCSLTPILDLWKITRNIAYFMLTIIFVLLGLAIMLRVRIDPRTVMTVQNQIPRIVICILLITFSYGIAGALIDLMWIGTYVGINTLTSTPAARAIVIDGNKPLGPEATNSVLQTPFAFFNRIMSIDGNDGLFNVTRDVSTAIGVVVTQIVEEFFSADSTTQCVANWDPFPDINIGACIGQALGGALGFLATIVFMLIIFITLLIILFRVWFELLKAYIFILFYVITAPIWIVFGLIPGRPLGFEKWLRGIFANVAVFPMVVGLFIAARIFLETFKSKDPHLQFSPPLAGNPNMDAFGTLLAFGVLLMAPTFLNMLRDALKVPTSKYTGAIMGTVGAGAAVPSAVAQRQWASLTRRDQQGNPTGVLSKTGSKAVENTLGYLGNKKWNPAKNIMTSTIQRRQNQQSGLGYNNNAELIQKNAQTARTLGPTSYYGHQAADGVSQLLATKNFDQFTKEEKKAVRSAYDADTLKGFIDTDHKDGGFSTAQRDKLHEIVREKTPTIDRSKFDPKPSTASHGQQQQPNVGKTATPVSGSQSGKGENMHVDTLFAGRINLPQLSGGAKHEDKTVIKELANVIKGTVLDGASDDKNSHDEKQIKAFEGLREQLEHLNVGESTEHRETLIVEGIKLAKEEHGGETPDEHKNA